MPIIRSVEAIPARFARNQAYLGSHDVPAGSHPYFRRPHLRAVYSRYFETTFVKITSDDGTVGWGECLAPVAPRVSAAIIEDLFAAELVGLDPRAVRMIRSLLYDMMRDRGYTGGFYVDAITAVDTALWDLKGKLLESPVASLLGGPYVPGVPCYVSAIGGVTDDEKRAAIDAWRRQGFENFKHHGGRGTSADLATMRAIVEAAGDDAVVGLDGHWVYSVGEAASIARALEELECSFFEAPIDPEDVEAHARLASAASVPIAIGENLRTRYEYKPWLLTGAAGILQPDVGRAGISESVALALMAEPFSVPIAPHLSVGLGPMVAASIHVAASIPNLYLLEYQPPTLELANSLLVEGIEVAEGAYTIPEGHGLGVEISEARLRDLQA
jgi:L-alanine-DL-glutamate epimerase-like enolase superfamily enzyme